MLKKGWRQRCHANFLSVKEDTGIGGQVEGSEGTQVFFTLVYESSDLGGRGVVCRKNKRKIPKIMAVHGRV